VTQHHIIGSDAFLDRDRKLFAANVQQFPARTFNFIRAVVPSLIGTALLFFVVGAALALGGNP